VLLKLVRIRGRQQFAREKSLTVIWQSGDDITNGD